VATRSTGDYEGCEPGTEDDAVEVDLEDYH
jgi:hypothetical protein